jgi:hypothetical protein
MSDFGSDMILSSSSMIDTPARSSKAPANVPFQHCFVRCTVFLELVD